MSEREELLQANQELSNASREVQRLLIRAQRLQQEALPKDLRVETDDYINAAVLAERSLNANIRIVAHIRVALKQTQLGSQTNGSIYG